jgi:hypothetical protein
VKPPVKPDAKPIATPAPHRLSDPKELRDRLDRAFADRDALAQKHTLLEKKLADAEAKGKDTAALAARAAELEKAVAERDAEIRMHRQEASPEFKAKYEAPFNEAAEYAKQVVAQLTVTGEDEVGNPTTRPAKWEDFASLYNEPFNKAIEKATAMFGPSAQVVINHLTELHRLDYVKNNALQAERANAQARMKEEDGKRVQSQEASAAAMARLNEELPQKFEAYRDPPEDKELADARAKGFAIFDAPPASPQQAMIKFAHIRQRAAAHGPLMMMNTRLKAEVERLKTELAGKTTTEPQPGRRSGGTETGGKEESWEEAANKELSNVR